MKKKEIREELAKMYEQNAVMAEQNASLAEKLAELEKENAGLKEQNKTLIVHFHNYVEGLRKNCPSILGLRYVSPLPEKEKDEHN